ncbi:MAG TPA: A/G-specific adenine glycosylase [Candidatus Acidoferrales bacterium]
MSWRPKSLGSFRRKLLRWFRANQRTHPWRRDRNPYRVWLAEVMLQQTRIAAVIPYYENFLAKFPDVRALAQASEHDLLRHWAGLGYYSRARNLRRAAKEIVEQHRSEFPRDHAAALKLPGIGSYTAAAVLSIAYDAPHAVLDGNVARVLARLTATRGDLRAPRQWQQLAAIAQELLPPDSAGDWNQALMELGETICTPKSPNCEVCPVRSFCEAFKRGLVDEIPAPRKKRAQVRQRIEAAVLLDSRGRTLLVRDPGAHDDVLFSRMWQFPAVHTSSNGGAELAKHLRDKYGFAPAALTELALAKHCVTFRNITLAPFLARVRELPKIARSRALLLSELDRVPISSATRKIAAAALDAIHSGVTDRGSARNPRAS